MRDSPQSLFDLKEIAFVATMCIEPICCTQRNRIICKIGKFFRLDTYSDALPFILHPSVDLRSLNAVSRARHVWEGANRRSVSGHSYQCSYVLHRSVCPSQYRQHPQIPGFHLILRNTGSYDSSSSSVSQASYSVSLPAKDLFAFPDIRKC